MTAALITGASAGLGLEFARILASEGYGLVLVARDERRLASVARELGGMFQVSIETLPADLSIEGDVARVAERLSDEARPIDLLVNNAGYGLRESFLDSTLEESLALDAVLNRAVTVLSWTAAHAMRERGRGGILTVASLAAFTTMGPYAASKSAAMVLAESLHADLAGTGVTVTAVLPGFIRTEFHGRAGLSMGHLPTFLWLEPSDVVRRALRDARAGRPVSVAGTLYRVGSKVLKRSPRSFIRGLSSGFRTSRARRSPLRGADSDRGGPG